MRFLLPLLALAAVAALDACHKPQSDAASNGAANGAAASGAPVAGKVDRSHAGQPAPATALQDPDGETVTLATFEGKPLLLNFWATWCAPCRKELPTLDKLAAGDKLQVVALSQDQDGREKVDAFFRQAHFAKLEAYLDPRLEVSGALKINDLPTTILFDAKGRELWRVTGDKDWQGPEARALVAEAFR